MRVQNAAVRPFDVSRLEEEVRDVVLQKQPQVQAIDYAPRNAAPAAAPTVPDYVSHAVGVTEIGKLSAEAVVKEYEETAKEIEAIGEVVKEMVQRCEQLTTSATAMLKDIKTTAQRYRKEGKRMFNEIESCSSTTDEVRKLCESFRDKVAKSAERTA
jgi:hypothetical protein